MKISKMKILGSGFTEEEYGLYQFERLTDPNDAMRFLSNHLNNEVFRPVLYKSPQQHLLEDKWVTHQYFSSLQLPTPGTLGVYHPAYGMDVRGDPLRSLDDLETMLNREDLPITLVLKPRGGRQGRNIIIVRIDREEDERLFATISNERRAFGDFVSSLPSEVFNDYGGGYDGWLIQKYIEQHPFMLELNPYTVNTFRIVTFIDSSGECKIHFSVLRLGRKGSSADNWDKGGIAVAVDATTGQLGCGVFKPSFGGQWLHQHPDTGAELEGRIVPDWPNIVETCKRAALSLSGIPSIGWDIALSPSGPVIIEGNATWSLPLVQVHTRGYLTEEVRADLSALGADFPSKLSSPGEAALFLFKRRWRGSRWPGFFGRVLGRS